MFIAHSVSDLQRYLRILTQASELSQKDLGFVPTMGYLHEGHLELVRKSKQKCALTVVTIFVNPAQFNNAEDLTKYPIDIPNDLSLLQQEKADLVFIPEVNEIYPPGYEQPNYILNGLDRILEGEFRPGHFQGVCAVISRFIEILNPGMIFLGQKDIQQCAVIGKLLNQLNGDAPKLSIVPTVRNQEGLALSSRNARISDEKLAGATKLYAALKESQQQLRSGKEFSEIKAKVLSDLSTQSFEVEYLELVAVSDMAQAQERIEPGNSTLVIAAWYEGVRLIDNIIL